MLGSRFVFFAHTTGYAVTVDPMITVGRNAKNTTPTGPSVAIRPKSLLYLESNLNGIYFAMMFYP